jgi:hypothetical protein
MPDGIHCGPFNVSGSVGLHPRSGVSAVPATDPRLGQVFAQVDGHLGYAHPSGTAYTLTPPATGPAGLWKPSDAGTQHIQPINGSYGSEVNSGTESQPGSKVGLGGQHGLYSVVAPVPFGILGISFEGVRAITIKDQGDGAGLQIQIPKHGYGPDQPRLVGEGTSGTGMYFPSNSGIGLSSEGVIGIEINRDGANMQARMPAGADTTPGISFADHHNAGLQLPDAGNGIDPATGQVAMLISETLQIWSGSLVTIERNTQINGMLEVDRASTGVTIVRQQSVATNDDPTHESFQGRSATTENGIGSLYSFTPATASNYTIKAMVTVRQTAGTGIGIGRSFEIIAHVQNIGGTVTVTQVSNLNAGTLTVTSLAFVSSFGTVTLQVQVEGLAGSGKSYVTHAHVQRFGPTGT